MHKSDSRRCLSWIETDFYLIFELERIPKTQKIKIYFA